MGFNSWRDFEDFEKDVKYKNRYVYSSEVDEFLNNIKMSLPERERSLASSSILFRSQIGYEEYDDEGQIIISGFARERMKPIPFKGSEGRANPKGISYLYLSNDEKTSMAELRPHIGEYISSAQFKINKNIRLVDCYSVPKHYDYINCIFNPPASQEDIGYAVWSMINNAFTKPIKNNESSADYAPTQILAELFKSEGFDGVCFKSSMGPGHNFILFDLQLADLINCTVMETKTISYEFSECANRYFVQEKHT